MRLQLNLSIRLLYTNVIPVDLLNWVKKTDIHPLIASCIFHYEIEILHPFTDGNGRMGRLWQTLILSQWRPELSWLPFETEIYNERQDYYSVLEGSDRRSDCTAFIVYMLDKLAKALLEVSDIQSPPMNV